MGRGSIRARYRAATSTALPMVSRERSSRNSRSRGTPAASMRSAITAASLLARARPSPWLPDVMIARLGRLCARWEAARARAVVEADGSPLAERPPPSTTATSGKPARSPSSVVTRGSDLTERPVHDHQSRKRVRAPRVLVDRVAIGLPTGDALLVVHRVVAVALP